MEDNILAPERRARLEAAAERLEVLLAFTPCRSDCPLIWSEIVLDFLETLTFWALYADRHGTPVEDNPYLRVEVLQIKEKFEDLRIYFNAPEEIADEVKMFAMVAAGKAFEATRQYGLDE
jgi:hypothetical protein